MDPAIVGLLRSNAGHAAAFGGRFDGVQGGQRPVAVSVSCSDSRVLQDEMWGNDEPGRIFTCSNIGNRVVQRTDSGDVVSGDVHYPIAYLDTNVALVVGHTGCGAVTAAYDSLTDGVEAAPGVAHCLDLLAVGLDPAYESLPADLGRSASINRLVERNVDRQVAALVGSDDVPAEVRVVGGVYDFQDAYDDGDRGEIHVVNVDGERRASELRAAYPEIRARIDRLWEY
ncbi:carbonic anhydrase [Haloplanus salilacus]|uniref:carbonic anhydrase n=1 Tax=Haloplanus salilacus TaxID=2949994 RepID=UPI0030CD5FD7